MLPLVAVMVLWNVPALRVLPEGSEKHTCVVVTAPGETVMVGWLNDAVMPVGTLAERLTVMDVVLVVNERVGQELLV